MSASLETKTSSETMSTSSDISTELLQIIKDNDKRRNAKTENRDENSSKPESTESESTESESVESTHSKETDKSSTFDNISKRFNISDELASTSESSETNTSYDSESDNSNSQYSSLITVVSDVKGDMHKILRLIDLIDKQANDNKSKTHLLQREINELRSELDKLSGSGHGSKSSFFQTHQTNNTNETSNSNETSNTDNTSMETSYTETHCSNTLSNSSVCSKDEFDRFKVDVMKLINNLAEKVDQQIRMFSSAFGGRPRIN